MIKPALIIKAIKLDLLTPFPALRSRNTSHRARGNA
jgi:hypothetical protein